MSSPMDANLSYFFIFIFVICIHDCWAGANSVCRMTSVHKETDSVAQVVFSALLVFTMRSACRREEQGSV